ncbi:MAG: hypothetical protein JWM56_238 [Candidatus Peribacteria bacterium]|nr:hypothetical protein [Candidatus Peribacteria bacterium]
MALTVPEAEDLKNSLIDPRIVEANISAARITLAIQRTAEDTGNKVSDVTCSEAAA